MSTDSASQKSNISAQTMISDYQASYYAHDLTRLGAIGEIDRLSTTLFDSKVDLNPHQVEAALFAMSNPLQKGVLLADEVGLGKTIEAGLVLCQRWAERRRRLIIVSPAHIRKQWQAELSEKFGLPSQVVDRRVWRNLRQAGQPNPFDSDRILIISYGFAARMKEELRAVPFDLVVMDEAHKLRNAYQPSRKGGQAVRWAFELRSKLLLSATPLQNSLLEIYGLGWIIDDHIFGDRSAFQSRYNSAGGDLSGLRQRLSTFCKRTLRKDCPYVNYTKRQAISHPFAQTAEEKSLYDDVLAFMQRDHSYAFPMRQRHLIEMILLKNLASSPQALASTLHTIRQRLVDLRDDLPDHQAERFWSDLTAEDDLDVDAFLDDLDFDADLDLEVRAPVDGRLLADELRDVEALIERAQRITTDSKSQSLLSALDAAFNRLEELGAKRKAVIFTESRKTQAFLADYLEANGYQNKVVTFNGSNAHPRAKDAYERYVRRHTGSDKLTGSKAVDIRSALIEAFEHDAEILLATEAAAEGVNLQFCSLVVNYDLPWNPQRIEQRIGRCHRYGQKYDVVVVNFLSEGNLADRRVQDLLAQKFNLFDGLFGASDEVLGAIEDNIDFERRVLDILRSCRTDEQIQSAFDQLQIELEDTISHKMADARRQLLDHFDADVHDRLKLRGDDARMALDRIGTRFWRLTNWGLNDKATFDDRRFGLHLPEPPAPEIPTGDYRLISAVRDDDELATTEAHLLRLSSPLGQWLIDQAKSTELPPAAIRFNVTGHDRKISMLDPLVGSTGHIRLDKLTLDSDAREEFLLFTAINEDGENLDQEIAQRLFDVGSQSLGHIEIPDQATQQLAADATQLARSTIARASEAGNVRFKQAQTQVDQWADDKIAAAEIELDQVRRELRAARRQVDLAENTLAQQEAMREVGRLETKRRNARRNIDDVEDEVEEKRRDLLRQLQDQCQMSQSTQTLFTIRFEAV